VINRVDMLTRPLVPATVIEWSFGLDVPDLNGFGVREHNGERHLAFGQELLLPVRELRMAGDHNIANALAALALGHAVGLPLAAMLQTLREFTGLAHRCQLVAQKNEIGFYDDSKGTNVGATIAAIEGLANADRKIVLIAGGVGKGAEFDALAPVLEQHGRAAVLIGEAADALEAVLRNRVPLARAASMSEAVARAAQFAQSGECVLLSPACASFDMFDNYAHRGEVFSAAVKTYLETP
jgi:UDP-N-acetylmuramoylalanine--D-glutamate ligase